MRVLALSSYPKESAATRFRVEQFIGPLLERGIELDVRPFLTSVQFAGQYSGKGLFRKAFELVPAVARRFGELAGLRKYDLIFVQREAMFFGPAIFEWLYQKAGRIPLVLDLDDATYVRYISPKYGKAGSFFKFFGKTDKLIQRSETVVCGNRFIAEYVGSKGIRTAVIPTIVDTDIFRPAEKTNAVPVIGWIGTHSTFPFLRSLFPVFEDLAKKHRFTLKIVGAGTGDISIPGVEIENLEWRLNREISDFQSFDIGLYPITVSDSANREWLLGKSGFKAIQYLAVGVPFVMSPVGVGAEIGINNSTHFNAVTTEDWYNSLDILLSDQARRENMGLAGREYSLQNYALPAHADVLADVLRNAAAKL